MAGTATATTNKPAWVDLATTDPAAARDFYSKLFGWNVEVNPDPQYGGYGTAPRSSGKDAAGIGGTQSPDAAERRGRSTSAPTTSRPSRRKVIEAGGTVAAAAVRRRRPGSDGRLPGSVGRLHLGVAGDPDGRLPGARHERVRLGRAERPRRRIGRCPFYEKVFGWTLKPSGTPGPAVHGVRGRRPEHRRCGRDEPDRAGRHAELLARVLHGRRRRCRASGRRRAGRRRDSSAPFDFPGGRMSIVTDPQGAAFGLMALSEG